MENRRLILTDLLWEDDDESDDEQYEDMYDEEEGAFFETILQNLVPNASFPFSSIILELQKKILNFLDCLSLVQMKQVSRHCRTLVKDLLPFEFVFHCKRNWHTTKQIEAALEQHMARLAPVRYIFHRLDINYLELTPKIISLLPPLDVVELESIPWRISDEAIAKLSRFPKIKVDLPIGLRRSSEDFRNPKAELNREEYITLSKMQTLTSVDLKESSKVFLTHILPRLHTSLEELCIYQQSHELHRTNLFESDWKLPAQLKTLSVSASEFVRLDTKLSDLTRLKSLKLGLSESFMYNGKNIPPQLMKSLPTTLRFLRLHGFRKLPPKVLDSIPSFVTHLEFIKYPEEYNHNGMWDDNDWDDDEEEDFDEDPQEDYDENWWSHEPEEFFQSLEKMTFLKSLQISWPTLRGAFRVPTSLESLSLHFGTGKEPPSMKHLTQLRHLELLHEFIVSETTFSRLPTSLRSLRAANCRRFDADLRNIPRNIERFQVTSHQAAHSWITEVPGYLINNREHPIF
eukprot:TRINITY_DN3121_c1_g1_i2.p1 TRINITY_DN3121_c1_g1~~TRINITY_DN3121_c1_g1_i2.p1  ORF type:complete len:527 (+),score=68.65 TRINITY_DN3121_c1_g1_i2:36-1583(+)